MSTEPRPKFSSEIAKIAAAEIVSRLIRNGHLTDEDREDRVSEFAKHGGRHADGFEIAKALEDHAWWDCDFQMAEILDGYGSAVYRAIEREEKAWAERVKPQSTLPVGARVNLPLGRRGEITGIYEYGPAKYLVKVDGEADAEPPTNSRLIINFEDARPEVATEAV